MITVKLHTPVRDANKEQEAFAIEAAARIQDMVNNPVFLERLKTLDYTNNFFYDCKKEVQATNDDLVRIISGGIEQECKATDTVIDNTIDLYTALEEKPGTVIGGVTPPSKTIETDPGYFDKWRRNKNTIALAGHWFHEWLHTAGFRHADKRPGEGPDYEDAVYKTGYLLVKVEQERQSARKSLASIDIKAQVKDYLEAYQYPADYPETFSH